MPREHILAAGSSRRGAKRRVLPAAAAVTLLALGLVAFDGNGQVLPPDRYALAFATAPTSVRLTADGRELLLEFSRALPDGEADRAAKALGPLLEGYAEGYGAIRFRLVTPVRTALPAATDPKTVVLTPDPEPEDKPDDRRRLALAEARSQARSGDLDGARVRLQQIAAASPEDIDPLLTLAEAETSAGRWQHALGLYDGIRRLFPEATDVVRDRDALSMSHAPSFRSDLGATFGPNGERSQTFTIDGDLPLGERWRANVSLQTTHDAIRGLRRPFSADPANYSAVKPLATVELEHAWTDPIGTTRLRLFAAPATAGGELKHDITTQFGDTTIGALYHQPYWGTVLAFAGNARRDQLGVAQLVRLPAQWQVQLGAGLVRYGIPGHDTVNAGPSVLAGLSKGLPAAWLPWDGAELRLGYRLEAEYLSHAQTTPTASGPLALLDTRAREVHSLYAEGSSPLGPGTATALLGYAIDRYGGGGPEALLRFTGGQDSDRLVFSAEAGVEPSLDIKPRTLFHLGCYAIWRFGA